MTGTARRRLILISVLPGAITVAWLAAVAAGVLPAGIDGIVTATPIPLITLTIAIGLSGASYVTGRILLRLAALLLLCATAPIALLYPWAAAGKIPGAVGDFAYFLSWLTRYPDLGPANIEVLAGISAVLAAGFLPALAVVLLLMRTPRRAVQATAALALIAYVPVLIRLDIHLAVVAGLWVDEYGSQPFPIYGPLIRAAAVLAVLTLAIGRAASALDATRPPPESRLARR